MAESPETAPRSRRPSVWIVANTSWYVFNFRARLLEHLDREGYAVTVLSPSDQYVSRITDLGARHLHLEMDNKGTNPVRDFSLILRLLSIFRRERPALLLTFTPKVNIYCAIAGGWLGIPGVVNVSGLGSGFIRGGWLGIVMKLLYKVAFRHPRKIFFQNEDDLRIFLEGHLLSASKTERLPGSGVDVGRFIPVPSVSTGRPFVFLMVARLLYDKGIREYVAAAKQIRASRPDVQFLILGFLDIKNPTAVSREEMNAWEKAGWVRYLGSTDEVIPHYAQADCVVLPSYREGCPRTLLEAASMAKPIVTTDTPGCRQVVDPDLSGFLARVADADDLAKKMEKMLALSADERLKMGQRGREKMIREFDERVVMDRYLAVVRETLAI
jgi:glycosyltransferase involved in cell wall biosynthesis